MKTIILFLISFFVVNSNLALARIPGKPQTQKNEKLKKLSSPIQLIKTADLSVSSDQALNFASRVGNSQSINVTLTDITPSEAVTINCIDVPEDTNNEFSGIPSLPLTIQPGQPVTFPLTYTPVTGSVTSPVSAKNYTLSVECHNAPPVTAPITATAYGIFPLVMSDILPVSSPSEIVYPTTYYQNFIMPQLGDQPVSWNLRVSNITDNDFVTSQVPTITNYQDQTYDNVKWSIQQFTTPITIPAHGYIDIAVTATPVKYIDLLEEYENARISWDLQLAPIDPIMGTDVSVHVSPIIGKINPSTDAPNRLVFNYQNVGWTQFYFGNILAYHLQSDADNNNYSTGLMIPAWQMLMYVTDMRIVGQGHEDFDIVQNSYNGFTSYFGTYNSTDKCWSNFAIGNSRGLYYLQTQMNNFGSIEINFVPQTHVTGYYSNLFLQLTVAGFSQPFQIPITVNYSKEEKLK